MLGYTMVFDEALFNSVKITTFTLSSKFLAKFLL